MVSKISTTVNATNNHKLTPTFISEAYTPVSRGKSRQASVKSKAWDGTDLTVSMFSRNELMKSQNYIEIWREYRDMGLSANSILNFQEQMIYHFPGKILSSNGLYELPKPCVITVWRDRRNVTNYKQADINNPDQPRRIIRRFERVQLLKLALDIRDVLMIQHPTTNDTIH